MALALALGLSVLVLLIPTILADAVAQSQNRACMALSYTRTIV